MKHLHVHHPEVQQSNERIVTKLNRKLAKVHDDKDLKEIKDLNFFELLTF